MVTEPSHPTTEARSISKSYGATPALREVSFAANRGEIVAVVGPSGSGKSTLLLCLAGILRPDAGQVWFADRRLDDASERDLSLLRRTDVGVLFQFGQLVAEMTAAENVALPLLLSGLRRREATLTARGWLERFDIGDLANERPTHMSGGQAQRVALARSLVTEPAVVFADEPTGALDSIAGERVLVELTRAAQLLGTTVVLVTHDAQVAAYADREVALRDGAVDDSTRAPQTSAAVTALKNER